MVNGFLDSLNLLTSKLGDDGFPTLGDAGVGTSRAFAQGYAAHKGALFDAFQAVVSTLGAAFPDRSFVLRPHPSENRSPWHAAAANIDNVHVVHEGNVIPWLLGSDALIHNGCTTAVEAAILGVPAIAYRPVESAPYDFDLPNSLSEQARSEAELCDAIGSLCRNGEPHRTPRELQRALSEYVTGLEGPLACERIARALAEPNVLATPRPSVWDWSRGWCRATTRSFIKQQIKARIPGHRNNPEFQRHRFPGTSPEDLQRRIDRLSRSLDRFHHVVLEPIAPTIYQIHG
jgi:hypothetical protein